MFPVAETAGATGLQMMAASLEGGHTDTVRQVHWNADAGACYCPLPYTGLQMTMALVVGGRSPIWAAIPAGPALRCARIPGRYRLLLYRHQLVASEEGYIG